MDSFTSDSQSEFERKIREQTLQLDAAPCGMLMADEHGLLTMVNKPIEELFGYTRAELIGQPVEILLPERYRAAHPGLRGNFFAQPATRKMGVGRDLYALRKDGSEVPVEIGLNPIVTDEGTFVLASIIDITERKASEEQLRLQSTALESAANAILITDKMGNIIWVNPAFTESTGYSQQEVIGKNPRFLKSGKQDDEFYEEMWDTILSGKVWRNTVINRRKDGTLNHEDMTITPIRNGSGNISHFVAIKQDITELERALAEVQAKREELAAMTQQLWQASKLATMGELSASIAHELNNPLATVALRLETLLTQVPEDDPKRRSLVVIDQEVDRMAGLVENLLEFSRRRHRQISTLDVRAEIINSIEFVHYHLRNRQIEIVRDFAEHLPTIQADRQQLRQLFLNLLTNAVDAMPKGGRLTVRARSGSLAGAEAVQIDFADTGGGIPEEHLEKIWEPFFTTKPEGKGTGLGLAICRRIVEEHGGGISIDSKAGEGTSVRIKLPVTGAGRIQSQSEAQLITGNEEWVDFRSERQSAAIEGPRRFLTVAVRTFGELPGTGSQSFDIN